MAGLFASQISVVDALPQDKLLFEEVRRGLQSTPKTLPCKLFYDEAGSHLFDQICELDEYYPTRTEVAIMAENLDEIASCIPGGSVLIEYGSGSSTKTCLLLDRLADTLGGYMPLDISRTHLLQSAERLRERYPTLPIVPLCADYTSPVTFPDAFSDRPRVVFFPGSTIGNFDPEDAHRFLRRVRNLVATTGGGLLIGVDLRKDVRTLEKAYNDGKGITARFNLNALRHLNRRFGANFVLQQFAHHAFFNEAAGRIEMHLVSTADQTVRIGPYSVEFTEGEAIHTESSYKYTAADFAELAARAGLSLKKRWMDPASLFSVQYFV
jgi:dimethylhistidine N-methyltransferase